MNRGHQTAAEHSDPESQRSACQAALDTRDVTAFASMLAPEVRWYGADGRLRARSSDEVLESARNRIADGILRDAKLTTWEQAGDRLVVGLCLGDEEMPERNFLCTLAGDRIVEVVDCPSHNDERPIKE